MGDLSKRRDGGKRHRLVLAVRGPFVHGNFFEAMAVCLEQACCFDHCRVDLSGVADVEAEGRLRQALKEHAEFGDGAADRFAFVHV